MEKKQKKDDCVDVPFVPIGVWVGLIVLNAEAAWFLFNDEEFIKNVNPVLYTVLILYLLISGLASHYIACKSDPGFLTKPQVKDETPDDHVCLKCGADRTKYEPFVHHCGNCKGCIYKMNHHCLFIQNCVGHLNRKYYILFNAYVCLNILA